MPSDLQAKRGPIEDFVKDRTQAERARITDLRLLSGGAIQENWALDVILEGGPLQGDHRWVLRTDSPSGVAVSLSRAQEYAVLTAAFAAGVAVPEPLWLCRDRDLIGRDFFIMRRLNGVAAGHRLVKDDRLVPDRPRLARQLGASLARLHAIEPPRPDLDFLSVPQGSPALATIADYRRHLDALPEPQPVLEWGLRWCERNAPRQERMTLIHRDYRTGNYMVDQGELTGVLDWEFAGWGNPLEDVGWFCARCWRFGNTANEAGGIGNVDDFLAGYAGIAGQKPDRAGLVYWEVMAHLRWAVIALQQAERHLSGEQPSLELALTGRIPTELEWEILELTGEQEPI